MARDRGVTFLPNSSRIRRATLARTLRYSVPSLRSLSMQKYAKALSAILLGSLIVFSVGAVAQSSGPVSGSAADNSKTNERDRADTVKPTDQSNAKADINVAATIRRAIVA